MTTHFKHSALCLMCHITLLLSNQFFTKKMQREKEKKTHTHASRLSLFFVVDMKSKHTYMHHEINYLPLLFVGKKRKRRRRGKKKKKKGMSWVLYESARFRCQIMSLFFIYHSYIYIYIHFFFLFFSPSLSLFLLLSSFVDGQMFA